MQKIAIHKMCMCVCIYLFIYLLTYLFDIQIKNHLYALHLLESKIFSKRWNVEIKKEKKKKTG